MLYIIELVIYATQKKNHVQIYLVLKWSLNKLKEKNDFAFFLFT